MNFFLELLANSHSVRECGIVKNAVLESGDLGFSTSCQK